MTEKKETPKKKATTKKAAPKKRVVVDRNTEVVFMNNTSGKFFYQCPKTHSVYKMTEYGDTDYITVDELLTMRNSSRKILNDLWILLIDVHSDEVSVEDVWKYLGVDGLYKDVINPEDIDGFIIKSTDVKFKDCLSKMGEALAIKVIERSVVLARTEQLNSTTKLNIIKNFTGNEDLFD